MRSYGKVELGFWQNKKVRPLSDDQKLLLVYLFSCPHGNSLGCFVLDPGYIIADLRWSEERANTVRDSLQSTKFVDYDPRTQLIRIVGWFSHNKIANPDHAAGCRKVAESLPPSPVFDRMIAEMRASGGYASAAIPEAVKKKALKSNELNTVVPSVGDTQVDTGVDTGVGTGGNSRVETGGDTTNTNTNTNTEKKDSSATGVAGAESPPAPSAAQLLLDQHFAAFWVVYPNRKNRTDAVKSFARAIKRGTPAATIIRGAELFARQNVTKEVKFIAHASTWLNNDRWETAFMLANEKPGSKPAAGLTPLATRRGVTPLGVGG